MDFSETYKHSGPCAWSPDGHMLAVAVEYRLVIRDVDTLQVIQLFSCLDKISYIEWSSDSSYILCALYKRAMVQAWSLADPNWTCKIDEGPAGIIQARWDPAGRHILTTAEFHLRITIWSLISKACVYIQSPKSIAKGVTFSHDGKFMAVATRKDCRDYLNILCCESWEIMGQFVVETNDLAGVAWSPDDASIAVWESVLDYKVLVYSPDGRCLARYTAYEHGLGIKTISWSPSGQFLSIGSFDQVARVLNHLTWKPFAEFSHLNPIKGDNVVIFKEVEEGRIVDIEQSSQYLLESENSFKAAVQAATEAARAQEGPTKAHYELVEAPVMAPNQKPPTDKPNPKLGIGLLEWSADEEFIMTRNDNMSTTLWIWSMPFAELAAVLVQKEPIKSASWDPQMTRIAICTGNSRVYMWSPDGASCVHIPLPEFRATNIKWNPSGSGFLLMDRDTFCCAFIPMPDENG